MYIYTDPSNNQTKLNQKTGQSGVINIDEKMNQKREMEKRERVMVVLEGVKASIYEKGTAPLQWALCDIITTNDNLFVLIILNPTELLGSPIGPFCCLGTQQQSLPCKEAEYIKFAHDQISKRREAYLEKLRLHYNRCKCNGVEFQVKVAVGCNPMEIIVEEANKVKATWIVLDRCFGGNRNLNDDYNVALVNDSEEPEIHSRLIDGLGNPKAKQLKSEVLLPTSPKLSTESILQEKTEILASRYYNFLQDSVTQANPYIKESVNPILAKLSTKKTTDEIPVEENRSPKESESTPMIVEMRVRETETNAMELESDKNDPSCSSGKRERKEDILQQELESHDSETIEVEARTNISSSQRVSEAMFVLREPLNFCWEELVEITEGFKPGNCISQQDEYEMYNGFCIDPDCHVMVKWFTGNSINGVVEAEMRAASSMSHQNILHLIGYHESSNGTALVHKFATKGTLDQYLYGYGAGKQEGLNVKSRMKIAIEISRFLRYMHEECPGGPVVHGNLQPYNIFLSQDFTPLVSGFGQAIWLHVETNCSYNRCCHKNPLDHESMELVKYDVFSFGILLLRLFCRRFEPSDDKNLIEWARPILERGAFHELLDEEMENADPYEIYRVMAAATKCTRTKPPSRPSMSQVVSMLRGENSCVVGSSPMLDNSVRGGKYSLLY